jgi:hypothetical protein
MRRSEKEDLSTDPCQVATFIEFDDFRERNKVVSADPTSQKYK